jgi:hypothetical protein
MKKIIVSSVALLLIVASCKKAEDKAVETTTTTDTTVVVKEEAPAQPMDSAAMMKAWEAYATPGDMHKELAKEAGSWTTQSTMWMKPDDPKPMMSTGSADIKMAMGGRYQIGTHKGSFMGMPFEGTSTVAYNNASKKYESTWVDNMGTGVMFMTGEYDAATKTTNFSGKCTDPMTGKEKTYRETWTVVDDNTRKMEMFDTSPDGKEFRSMEMTMTRKK